MAQEEAKTSGSKVEDNESDVLAIREAAMKELRELTAGLDAEDEELIGAGRYVNHWNEDDWEEDFDNHPLFMKEQPKDPANLPPLIEAMRQLKFDPEHNTSRELAEKYKNDGNENFRLKKYRWAIDNYTEGIKQKCDDLQLNSVLYANRSASHLRIGNVRSALKDSLRSLVLNPRNSKAINRIAECYFQLKDYAKCEEFCKRHVLDHPPLEQYMSKSRNQMAKVIHEAQIQRQKEQVMEDHREKLLQLVQNDRKIDLRGDLFQSHHPGANDRHVELSEEGHLLWPVVFVYPEVSQADFIEYFDEEATLLQQLEIMFPEDEAPAWDTHRKYRPDRLKVGFIHPNAPDQMRPVDVTSKLRVVLSSPDYCLVGANPTFVVVPSSEKRMNKN